METLRLCVACEKPMTAKDKLDEYLCDPCINEAMQHRPTHYVKISLHGFGSYVQPMDQFATAMDGEFDDVEVGTKWTIEIIEMTPAEYAALPDFAGH